MTAPKEPKPKKLEWDFNTLYNIAIDDADVDKREQSGKKGTYYLYYLKWSVAWRQLLQVYPHATYRFERFIVNDTPQDCQYHVDNTATVHCTVSIGDKHQDMWLPVMNYQNNAIKNPDARDISDTKMRCLVKCIAMLGLGMSIYEGKWKPKEEIKNENTSVDFKRMDEMNEAWTKVTNQKPKWKDTPPSQPKGY